MDAFRKLIFIVVISCLLPVFVQESAELPNDCATKLVQVDGKGREYVFAYAKALQEQNSQSSAEALCSSLPDQYRPLAKATPSVYLPSVAATLNNLGLIYAESGCASARR